MKQFIPVALAVLVFTQSPDGDRSVVDISSGKPTLIAIRYHWKRGYNQDSDTIRHWASKHPEFKGKGGT